MGKVNNFYSLEITETKTNKNKQNSIIKSAKASTQSIEILNKIINPTLPRTVRIPKNPVATVMCKIYMFGI